ncbi:MAG: dienelactone hydrolase family protein [Nocardioides sp.]
MCPSLLICTGVRWRPPPRKQPRCGRGSGRHPCGGRSSATTLRARSQFDIAPVGQIGFSMGGHWALWLSKQSRPEIPPITATSVFYATRGGDFTASTSAFQFHLAETDPFVTKAGVAHQERQLRAAGRQVELHRYPGTGHWFFEQDRPDSYDSAAANLAWRRTVKFLDRHFPPPTHALPQRATKTNPRPVTPHAGSFKVPTLM